MGDTHTQNRRRRMSKIVTLLFVLIATTALSPRALSQQDSALVELMTKVKYADCPTYILNAKRLIPTYYYESRLDSIDVVLGFVEDECGDGAATFEPLRNLLAMEQGTLRDPMCNEEMQSALFNTWSGWGFSRSFGFGWSPAAACSPDDGSYDMFIEDLIRRQLEATDSLSENHIYCRYLLGEYDYILSLLHSGYLTGTCLGDAYAAEVSDVEVKLRDKHRGHYSMNLGVWSPQDAAGTLGDKVELGGQFGIHDQRLILQVSGFLRFLKSANTYEVMHQGRLVSTDEFFGGYFGAEVGLEAIRLKRFALDLHVGIGYDGWNAITEDQGQGEAGGINALNLNLGGTIRVFHNKERTRYLGVQGRYNFVDYGNDGGTDLSGNTITVHLVGGFLGNTSVVDRAKTLHYYD